MSWEAVAADDDDASDYSEDDDNGIDKGRAGLDQLDCTRSQLARCRRLAWHVYVSIVVMVASVALIYPWTQEDLVCDRTNFEAMVTVSADQSGIVICSVLLLFFWYRSHRMSGVAPVIGKAELFLVDGLSFWVASTSLNIFAWCGFPSVFVTLGAAATLTSCALLDFTFLAAVQERIEITEGGFGADLGSRMLKRVRTATLVLMLSATLVIVVSKVLPPTPGLGEVRSSAFKAFTLFCGIGALVSCVIANAAFSKVLQGMRLDDSVCSDGYVRSEQEWATRALRRVRFAIVVPCAMSAASHLLVLVMYYKDWTFPGLTASYHLIDITTEAICVFVVVGLFTEHRPELRVSKSSSSAGMLKHGSLQRGSTVPLSLRSPIWKQTVRHLAERSVSIGSLLDFYEKLGPSGSIMTHYDPYRSTTTDVVRSAIIPLSRSSASGGRAYADVARSCGPVKVMPHSMVTHTWSNLFLHLVAACVADSMDAEEYRGVAKKLANGGASDVRKRLSAEALKQRYWICAFCVNQHAGICASFAPEPDPSLDELHAAWERSRRDSVTGEVYPLCPCQEPKYFNDNPDECEMNKFDDMMLLLQEEKNDFRQVLAVDADFRLFTRIWCVAEIVAAHYEQIPQTVMLESNKSLAHDAEDLTIYHKLATLTVAHCEASRAEDREEILAKIPDVRAFDAQLQATIFDERGILAHKFVGFGVLEAAARAARRVTHVATQNSIQSLPSLSEEHLRAQGSEDSLKSKASRKLAWLRSKATGSPGIWSGKRPDPGDL